MSTVAAALAHRGPWEQNPIYLAAVNRQVAPGGPLTYVATRCEKYTLRNKTTFIAGHDDSTQWSENQLPDILSIINPPNAWCDYRRLHQPDAERNTGGVVRKERWPEPRSKARALRKFDVLPDQIFSGEPGWVIESWMRLDPTIQYEDILMRMYRFQRPPSFNALNMRRLRARDDLELILWERRSISVNARTQRILTQLPAHQVAANSTAAPIPATSNSTTTLVPGADNSNPVYAPVADSSIIATTHPATDWVSARRLATVGAAPAIAPASAETTRIKTRHPAPDVSNSTTVSTSNVTTQANSRRRARIIIDLTEDTAPSEATQVNTRRRAPIVAGPASIQSPVRSTHGHATDQALTRTSQGPLGLGLALPPPPVGMRVVYLPEGIYYVPVQPSSVVTTSSRLHQNTQASTAVQAAHLQRDDVTRAALDLGAPGSATPGLVALTPPAPPALPAPHPASRKPAIPHIIITAPDTPDPVPSPPADPRPWFSLPPLPPRALLSPETAAITTGLVRTPAPPVIAHVPNPPTRSFSNLSRAIPSMRTDMDTASVVSRFPRYTDYVHPLARWPLTYGWKGPRFRNTNNGA